MKKICDNSVLIYFFRDVKIYQLHFIGIHITFFQSAPSFTSNWRNGHQKFSSCSAKVCKNPNLNDCRRGIVVCFFLFSRRKLQTFTLGTALVEGRMGKEPPNHHPSQTNHFQMFVQFWRRLQVQPSSCARN